MAVRVKLKYLRISPRKVRLVADLIRKKSVLDAENILRFTMKKAAKPIEKLLKSGIATAENDFQLEKSNLYVSEIKVDEGPTLKRWRFGGRGSTKQILKRTSHITLVLDEIKPGEKIEKVAKVEKEKKPKVRKPKKEKLIPRTVVPRPKLEKAVKRIFRRKAF